MGQPCEFQVQAAFAEPARRGPPTQTLQPHADEASALEVCPNAYLQLYWPSS
jgi:hypothetical protein